MERLEYVRYGGPEVVHLASFKLPPLQAHEVRVRVAAASINPMDWKLRSGSMRMVTGSTFPRGVGSDFAGTIEAVGSKVSAFSPGDEVVGTVSMKSSGAFAPSLNTADSLIVKKPAGLSFAQAAVLPIAGVTAWLVLVKNANLTSGQKVFINGATGAVGHAAISIAHNIGAEVVGRVGPKSVMDSKALGLSIALDYTKPISPSLNRSFDVVFDANGSLTAQQGERLIKHGGKVYDIVPTAAKFMKSLVSLSRKVVIANVKSENLQAVIDLAVSSKLVIPIIKTLCLADAPVVLAALERGERINGKAVIVF